LEPIQLWAAVWLLVQNSRRFKLKIAKVECERVYADLSQRQHFKLQLAGKGDKRRRRVHLTQWNERGKR
jgi:hypothetical protein